MRLKETVLLFMRKFDNFCKVLDNLRQVENVSSSDADIITLTGSAALFEICFEQAWKAMKEILTDHGYAESATGSPKMIIKLAYSAGMISDEAGWIKALETRNNAAHSYNEEIALEIVALTKSDFIRIFEELKSTLEEKWI